MNDLPRIPAEAKEIIKNKRTGKVYESKEAFDADCAPKVDLESTNEKALDLISINDLILHAKKKDI